MPVEKLTAMCDHHDHAAIIAVDRESDTICEEAGGYPLPHHSMGLYPPQFPQLCECVIARAPAEGIEGTVLDRLLANQWDGVPMDVADRYRLIFIECTKAAVAGDPMALPAQPSPDHETDVTHGGSATASPDAAGPSDPPVVAAPPAGDALPGVPAGYRITHDAAPAPGAARSSTRPSISLSCLRGAM